MFNFLKTSLRNRLLSIFIAIGFLPFLAFLIYLLFLSETKIVNKIVVEQLDRTQVVIKLINNHLNSITKEVNFLSSLDLMDDLLADDIDKRISRLLTQKYDDLNLDLSFMVVGLDSNIIASSNKELLQKKYDIKKLTSFDKNMYVEGKKLFIYSDIKASFDENNKLGFLVLKYNLDNLDLYLTHQNNIHSFIVDKNTGLIIGDRMFIDIDFSDNVNSIINDNHVVVYQNLSLALKDWHVVYAVDKNVALEFLYDFISFILYMSIIIFILVLYISIKQSKEMVKPIEKLTAITNEIISTQNYSIRLQSDSQDEIATLTHSFNNMLQTTSSALKDLEEENKLRLKRFTQLINVFNTIIQTKSEDECMDVSINNIKKLTNKENLYFVKDIARGDNTLWESVVHNQKYTDIFVTDFENDTKIYFGSIELGVESFEDKNEKDFYNSIASMITLQLDRIRLIERTMSASKAKSAFISNMSHELRTPLNAIIGFAQFMIAYEDLNEDQQDTVGSIESSAQYLLSMINEILDIAKIEAGKMEAHIEQVNILELLQSSYDMLSPLATDKNLDFNFIYDKFEQKSYETDPKMFKQIVINLISNAIKFTEKGSVILELYNDEKNLCISIKDTGIGIAEDDIKQLFNDFTQVENVMQKKHKGTGLGLSLSRKMAKILHGDIKLESEGIGFGCKSIFTLTIK